MQSIETDILYDAIRDSAQQDSNISLKMVDRLANNNAKDIHQLRVNCKRLRAYWRFIRPLLKNSEIFIVHNNHLREAARLLSQSREAHVNRKLLRNFMAQCNEKRLRDVIAKMLHMLPLPTEQQLLPVGQLHACFIDERTFWEAFTNDQIKSGICETDGLVKTFNKAEKLANRTLQNDFEPTIAHEWRKWSKYFYYQLQALSTKQKLVLKKKVLANLDQFNDDLGKLHDFYVLENLVVQAQKKQQIDGAVDVLRLITGSRHQLEQLLKKMQKKIYQKSFNELVCRAS